MIISSECALQYIEVAIECRYRSTDTDKYKLQVYVRDAGRSKLFAKVKAARDREDHNTGNKCRGALCVYLLDIVHTILSIAKILSEVVVNLCFISLSLSVSLSLTTYVLIS